MTADSKPIAGPVVQIDRVTFAYDKRKVLDEIDLQVWTGEMFGLLGPNGSGKSTLFRLLSTLVPLQGGSIRVFGRDVTGDQKVVRRTLGVVFQAPALDIQLTATENLLCHGKMYGLSGKKLRGKAKALLTRFNLADRAGERVKTFSGGMRRKVELAKALLTDPRLLVLDEPSTGLDPAARVDLWDTIAELKRETGMTVVFTTHLMDEADRCDRLAVIDKGKVLVCDTPEMIKASVGGDVITLSGHDLPGMQAAIHAAFGIEGKIADNALRIERPSGHLFIPQLIAIVPGVIDSVSLGRPTLDDAFIRMTGRRLSAV